MQKSAVKNLLNGLAIGITAAIVIFGVYGWCVGWFKDIDSMRTFVGRAGVFGPMAFITIQILQVVLPFIPGGMTLIAGVVIFGPVWGFVLNCAGVAIGSAINFVLAKKYGKKLVTHLVEEETYNKYIGKIENSKKFECFFALAILLPFFPDDTLCLIAGLTNMSYQKFAAIILLGKPLTIVAYSIAFVSAGQFLPFLLK